MVKLSGYRTRAGNAKTNRTRLILQRIILSLLKEKTSAIMKKEIVEKSHFSGGTIQKHVGKGDDFIVEMMVPLYQQFHTVIADYTVDHSPRGSLQWFVKQLYCDDEVRAILAAASIYEKAFANNGANLVELLADDLRALLDQIAEKEPGYSTWLPEHCVDNIRDIVVDVVEHGQRTIEAATIRYETLVAVTVSA